MPRRTTKPPPPHNAVGAVLCGVLSGDMSARFLLDAGAEADGTEEGLQPRPGEDPRLETLQPTAYPPETTKTNGQQRTISHVPLGLLPSYDGENEGQREPAKTWLR